MQQFTGWQYMLIDLANHFGMDKELFETRIKWAEDNLHQLESLIPQVKQKDRPLFHKAVLAIRKVLSGKATGHIVGMDCCCSGLQVMSALTGCKVGAYNTGLIDPNKRMDAYTNTTKAMEAILNGEVYVDRQGAKDALMKALYGSKAEPKKIFGEDTPELSAFYKAMLVVAPGATELLEDLRNSWNANALKHEWKLPDGFEAVVKVMQKVETRIEVDELNHSTFTYEYYVNQGTEKGLSNIANVVHSVDAYLLRSIIRRVSYDKHMVEIVVNILHDELAIRMSKKPSDPHMRHIMVDYYIEQYKRSSIADIVILPFIDKHNVAMLDTEHIRKLIMIINTMLTHEPFEMLAVHDEYKCSPNNMNHLRQHFINVLAEIAESNLLDDLLSQIYGKKGTFKKLSNDLGTAIRGSNYGLS